MKTFITAEMINRFIENINLQLRDSQSFEAFSVSHVSRLNVWVFDQLYKTS